MDIPERLLEEAVALTRQLVAIPSENVGSPCEQAVHAFLRDYLDRRGVCWRSLPAAEGRENLVVRFPSSAPGRPKLVIFGHMDTVSAAGMVNPFAGELGDGRIAGRGACDDKGPLATALTTLLCLREKGIALACDVTFVATSDEESGMRGARALADAIGPFDLGIALEPTRCRAVTAHKGLCRFAIQTRGKAAHSSQPHLGVNAIEAMLAIAASLRQYGERLSRSRDADLGHSTLTITQIAGGSAPNIVPAECQLTVDARLVPEDDTGHVEREVQRRCGPEAAVRTLIRCRGIRTDADIPLVRALRAAIAAEGGDAQPAFAHYATDASQLAHLGPCVVWGPGDIAQAHRVDEYIQTMEIDLASRILWRFLHG